MNTDEGAPVMHPSGYVPEQVIVHEIPKHRRSEAGSGPYLSDVVDPLTGDVKDYFRDKIRDTLIEKGHQVRGDPDTKSGVPATVAEHLRGDSDLLVCSRQLATQLYATQSGSNSAGLLIVLAGAANGSPALAILKLERQQGVRVMREMTANGQLHFNVSHLRDLMLNERTRVFKAGVFMLAADGKLEGVVSDEQRGSRQDEVAKFFLSTFLGCQLRVSATRATKSFFTGALDWINDRVEEPESKTRYLLAVMSEMNSEDRDIDPAQFAQRNLDPSDVGGFLQYLAANAVPATAFEKDIKLIKPQLRAMRIDIENNIVVLVPPNQGDKVSFSTDAADDTPVTSIRGALKGVRGR